MPGLSYPMVSGNSYDGSALCGLILRGARIAVLPGPGFDSVYLPGVIIVPGVLIAMTLSADSAESAPGSSGPIVGPYRICLPKGPVFNTAVAYYSASRVQQTRAN